jgi:hypothetical protein
MHDAAKKCSAPKKGPTIGKVKKWVAGAKRHELGIYETELSILENLQRINKNQRTFFEKIQGICDALYIY